MSEELSTLRDSIKRVSPTWLQGTWGYRFMYTLGVHLDAVAEALRQGVLARFPGYGTLEALPHIGKDRQILRGFQETSDAYIERLQQAIPTWRTAGNAQSVIKQLLGYVSPYTPKIRYVTNGEDENGDPIADYVTIENGSVSFYRASPNNWNWDGSTESHRFWIIVYPGVPAIDDRTLWGDGHLWGDGTSWGSGATSAVIGDMKNLIKKWKRAGSQCLFLIFAFDNTDYDPTNPPGPPMPNGDWDNPANREPTSLFVPVGF